MKVSLLRHPMPLLQHRGSTTAEPRRDSVSRTEGAGQGIEKVSQAWGRLGGIAAGGGLAAGILQGAAHLVHPAVITLGKVGSAVALSGVLGSMAVGAYVGFKAAGPVMHGVGRLGERVARKMGVSEVAGRRVAKGIVGAGIALMAGLTLGSLHLPGAALAIGTFGAGALVGAIRHGRPSSETTRTDRI